MEKMPLVVLTGPTGVGKTKLSVELAKRIQGEIISADSMQVYRHMDIGSAKITQAEMQGIPHHMIDILEPTQEFNVVIFQRKCRECLDGIYKRGNLPIMAGGTGFYIQAVLNNISFIENKEKNHTTEENCTTEEEHTTEERHSKKNGSYRAYLEQLGSEKGADYLHRMLLEADPVSAGSIHANNIKRTIRALEFYHLTGERISEHNEQERKKESAYRSCCFVLNDSRPRLYARIDARVDRMLAEGLVDEVRKLLEMGCGRELVSMQGLGYKEIASYLAGEISLERAIYLIKRDTRHFAKRQLTWFRREKEVIWLDKDQFRYDDANILSYMLEQLRKKEIYNG